MCRMFSGQDPARFDMVTRKVRLGGHSTSVRLEAAFWETLEEIASVQGVTLGRFLTKLHDEVLENAVARKNFAGLLRCACLTYAMEIKDRRPAFDALTREAEATFGNPAPTPRAPLIVGVTDSSRCSA